MSPPALPSLVLSLVLCFAVATAQQNISSTGSASNASATGESAGQCEGILAQCLRDIDAGKIVDCPLLPYVSSELRSPPAAPRGYTLKAIRPGLWAYWDGGYFSLIIQSSRILAIIDVPSSQFSTKTTGSRTRVTDAVQEVLAGSGSPPQEIHFWYSHPHADHIGAVPQAYKFLANLYPNAKLRVFAPEIAFRALAAFRTINLPKVTDTVIQNMTYTYGEDLDFKVMFLNGHTEADLALYFAPTKKYGGLVYTVDLVYPGVAPFFYFGYTRNVAVSNSRPDFFLRFSKPNTDMFSYSR
jgi:glyoxylase-like metal-dependent hydrolase (beta-lactamase superfamily II)